MLLGAGADAHDLGWGPRSNSGGITLSNVSFLVIDLFSALPVGVIDSPGACIPFLTY